MPAKILNLPNIKVDEEVDEEINRKVYKGNFFFSLRPDQFNSVFYITLKIKYRRGEQKKKYIILQFYWLKNVE